MAVPERELESVWFLREICSEVSGAAMMGPVVRVEASRRLPSVVIEGWGKMGAEEGRPQEPPVQRLF